MSDVQSFRESELSSQALERQHSFYIAFSEASKPLITYAVIGVNALIFLGMLVSGASFLHPTTQQAIAWGANFGPLTVYGQWWRLITACFVHFGIVHIGMNMFILWQVGQFTEKLFGYVRFFVLYLLSGIGGNLLGLYYHPLTVSAGASGAVFGVYGGLLAYLLVQRNVVPTASALAIAKSAGIFIVYNIIYGLSSPETDMVAHIGGLIAGFVIGCALARPLTPHGQGVYPIRTLAVCLFGVIVTYNVLHAFPEKSLVQDNWTLQLTTGKSVVVGNNEKVVYSGAAERSEAESLAKVLQDIGYFHKPNGTVLLSRDANGTLISLPTGQAKPGSGSESDSRLTPLPWEDPQYVAGAEAIGVAVAPTVGGPPIKVALLSRDGDVERVIDINARLATIGKNDSVWYSGAATLEDAQTLGQLLQQEKFFIDSERRVFLEKGFDGTSVSFMVKEGTWTKPAMIDGFHTIGRKIAKSFSKAPLTIYLIDSSMERRKAIRIR